MTEMATGAGTIVVIEDDPHIADLIDMYLRPDGHRVISVDRGEAGLEAVQREKPRLVVLDIGLPGATGSRLRVRGPMGIDGG